jgi:arsenical-resistance protein
MNGHSESKQLSRLDRNLPVWIGLAIFAGLVLGASIDDLDTTLNRVKVDTVSLPIALGLLVMMYPVLAKVRYRSLGSTLVDRRPFAITVVMNWLVGPLLMFALAWLFLADSPSYRTGLVIVGLAPCIAMVIIWIDLAQGDNEIAAVLVAINAILQVVLFSLLGYFYLKTLPGWLGLDSTQIDITMWEIAKSVAIFLGVPLVAGSLTRTILEARRGTAWYESVFLPRVGPFALYGLLFTVVVLFALQGEQIRDEPWDVVRIALPLLAYFLVMWFASFEVARRMKIDYPAAVSVAFTSAGNNFELAIAVNIAVFGVTSGEALAGVVGPLIEVPVLIALVYVARARRSRT